MRIARRDWSLARVWLFQGDWPRAGRGQPARRLFNRYLLRRQKRKLTTPTTRDRRHARSLPLDYGTITVSFGLAEQPVTEEAAV